MNKRLLSGLFLILFGLGLWFRFQKLDSVPLGLYVDEASIGENAYLIYKTGADEWHAPYPVFFKAFGEYKNPLLIYSTAVLFTLLPPTISTLRLSVSLWGVVGIILTAWASWEITHKKLTALFTALILLFMPWDIHASRVVFEVITMPAVLALSLVFWVKALQTHSLKWSSITALSLSLLFYSYTAARLFAPLFLAVFVLQIGRLLGWKPAVLSLLVGSLGFLPAFFFNGEHPGSLLARYHVVAVHQPNGAAAVKQMLLTYVNQFNPQLWLITGDTNPRHSPLRGLLPFSWFPLFLLGLARLVKTRAEPVSQGLLFILLTAPAAAALTQTDPNALRQIHLIPILALITALGFQTLLGRFPSWSYRLISLALLGVLLEFAVFIRMYFTIYPEIARPWFDADYVSLYPYLRNLPGLVVVHSLANQVTSDYLELSYPQSRRAAIVHTDSSELNAHAFNVYPLGDCDQRRQQTHSVRLPSTPACILTAFATIQP